MTEQNQEYEQFLKANPDVRYVDCLMVDICGNMRGKRYPVADVPKLYKSGMQICYSVYLLDVLGESLDPVGRGFTDGDPDGSGFPVEGTLVPSPWAKRPAGQILLSFREESDVGIADPRNVLKHVLQRYEADKIKPVVALELEFYLIDRERGERGTPQFPIAPGEKERSVESRGVYSILELDAYQDFIYDIEEAARIQKIDATVVTREYSPGQFEVNLNHSDDVLKAADQAALLRWMITNLAIKHGYEATFMSKPFADQAGSGMHMHFSMLDDKGQNIFDDGKETPDGSDALKHAIGGLGAAMAESMSIFAANPNAMRRFEPDNFTPVNPSWSVNNRSAAFRIPEGPGAARRIEHRISGAEANPYLVAATVLAAAHHGLTNKIDPGPEWTGNAGATMSEDVPFDFQNALDILKKADILKDYLTPEYVEAYRECKQLELDKFKARISPIEYDFYL